MVGKAADQVPALLVAAVPGRALPLLILGASRLRLSNGAYTCVFPLLCAHEVGAHFTYSMVPYDEAVQALSGHSLDALLGFRRNHFDRLVHFLFGLLLLPAIANIGMPGASAFRAIAGFGRHGQMRESHFGELSGSQPVLVEFLLTEEDAENLLKSLAKEPVAINYARTSVELGVVGARS